MARKLTVEIIGDATSLERAFGKSSRAADKFGTNLGGVGSRVDTLDKRFQMLQGGIAGAFVGGAAAAAAVEGIRTVTQAASDLNEQQSKSQQVFGDSAAAIQAWSTTTAKSFGISQTAALEAAGTFGNLFTAMGIAQQPAADLSRRLTELAADLASFNNASIEDALMAIRSGLVGEVEPLRRFGVQLSAVRVQQEALAETGKDSVKALTQQELAAARVAVIFRDTAKAQGDFQRTSGGLANQQRILAAQTQDLEANLGKLLLPAILGLTRELNKAAEGAGHLIDGLHALGSVQIPDIHIPFVVDIGGKSIGGGLGDFAKRVAEGAFGASNPAIAIAIALGNLFKQQAAGATPQLANSFAESINLMTQNALDTAAGAVKPPKPTGPKGFGTGLKPEDLYGPVLTKIPEYLQEALLDAEKTQDPKKIIAALNRHLVFIANELSKPSTTTKDRVALKTLRNNILSQIDAQNSAIQGAIDAANQKRQDAIDKATAAQKDANAKAKAKAEKLAAERQKGLEAAQAALQARQFRAIGLGPTGGELVPGVANLREQFESLSKRLVGHDISSKLRAQFRGAGKILSGSLGKATVETRDAIRQLFQTIRDTFDQETKKTGGPLTKGAAVNAGKILAGLGLAPNIEQTLRARLSRLNSVTGTASAPRIPRTSSTAGFTTQPVVETHTTIMLDSDVVARAVTRSQQKTRRRNPAQKRGMNRGG